MTIKISVSQVAVIKAFTESSLRLLARLHSSNNLKMTESIYTTIL